VDTTREQWEQALWHLSTQRFVSTQRFACVPDARTALTRSALTRTALARQLKTCPAWLQVESVLVLQPTHRRPGRPRKDAPPDQVAWQLLTTRIVDAAAGARAARRKAAFLVATNVLDPPQLCDHELIRTYKEQPPWGAALQFSQRPAVSGFFGLREEGAMSLATSHRMKMGPTLPPTAVAPADANSG
jgi:hypothetical protein